MPDEKTYLVMHPSRWKYVRWYLPAVLLIAAGISVIASEARFGIPQLLDLGGYSVYGFLVLMAGLLLFAIGGLARVSKTYYITSYRIIERTGIINTDENSVNWDRIANYSILQGAVDKMLNIGTIDFDAMTGEMDKDDKVRLAKVANLSKVKALLDGLATEKEAPV